MQTVQVSGDPVSNLLTAAAPKNASPAPRQGEAFDVHFEQAGNPAGTGDKGDKGDTVGTVGTGGTDNTEPEIPAENTLEVTQAAADPDDDSPPSVDRPSENAIETPKQIVAETSMKSTAPDSAAVPAPPRNGGNTASVDIPRTTKDFTLPTEKAGVTSLGGLPAQMRSQGSPTTDAGSQTEPFAAKGLQPIKPQGSGSQLAQNAVGTNVSQSPDVNPKGANGAQVLQVTQSNQGTLGTQGTQGMQGTQSTQGMQGTQGTQGTQSTQGMQGMQGTQGAQGTQGTQGAQGMQSTQGTPTPRPEGTEGKTRTTNSDAMTTPKINQFAASRPPETSDMIGRAPVSPRPPVSPSQSSGQTAPAPGDALLRGHAPELLTVGNKPGFETQLTQRATSASNSLIADIVDTPRLRELAVKPDRNGLVTNTPNWQNSMPVTLTNRTPIPVVSDGKAPIQQPRETVANPVSGGAPLNTAIGAGETPAQTSAFGLKAAKTAPDELLPSRSRRSIRGDDARTIEATTAPIAKAPVQAAKLVNTVQNQPVSAINLQPVADQPLMASELTPSEHFVTPLSEPGLQSGNLRAAETMLARPEAARMVATQMAEAMMRTHNNKVEIALRPEELGRVRMVLSTTELGITVSIIAERSETLDLMRRHIDQLAEEFRELGYQNIGFEFSGGESSSGSDGDSSDPQSHIPANPDDQRDAVGSVPIQTARASLSSGLDLRL